MNLWDLSKQISDAHQAATEAATVAVRHARTAGTLLVEAKTHVKHGDWGKWLDGYCPSISRRTAENYMRLARLPEEEAKRVSLLPLREALRSIQTPKAQTSHSPTSPTEPPTEFPKVDDDLPTEFCCPKCRYEWSGPARPGRLA